jgi:hypothetical protein
MICVAPWAEWKFKNLPMNRFDNLGMAISNLMDHVPVEVEITSSFDILQPRSMSRFEDIEARCGKALMDKGIRILRKNGRCSLPNAFASPLLTKRGNVDITFRGAASVT